MANYPTMNTYAARMTKIIAVLLVLISLGGIIFFWVSGAATTAQVLTRGAIFAAGAFISCLHNILKLYWLKSSVTKATTLDPIYAANYVRGQGMFRMFFTLAVLVGAGFLSQIEALGVEFLIGAILGLLTMPLAGYSMMFFTKSDYAAERSNTDV
jgi:hypothetical protein